MYVKIKIILLTTVICVESRTRIYASAKPLVKLGERYFQKEILTDVYEDPKELAYDSSSRNLYFMYMDQIIQNSGRAYFNTLTKETAKIGGIKNNKATAVDSESGDVYFGSEDGIYKYDPLTNQAMHYALENVNIFKLIVRNNHIYYIDARNHKIYKFINEDMVEQVGNWENVLEFHVDNQRNIHIVTMDGLYCYTKDEETIKNTDLTDVYIFIIEGTKTLGVTINGIFDIKCLEGKARKIGDIGFLPRSMILGDYGVVFLAVGNYIIKMTPVRSYLIYTVDSPDFNNITLTRNNTRHIVDV